jgi:ElaB/YqjD/DUF883 family membrane-anchored ribosome-binding protein
MATTKRVILRRRKLGSNSSHLNGARRVGADARRISHDILNLGGSLRNLTQEQIDLLRHSVVELLTNGEGRVRQAQLRLGALIQENPWQAVLSSAGLGLLLGALSMQR